MLRNNHEDVCWWGSTVDAQTASEAKARKAGGLFTPARPLSDQELREECKLASIRRIGEKVSQLEREDLAVNYAITDLEFGYGEYGPYYAKSADEAIAYCDEYECWFSDRLERAIDGLADPATRETSALELFRLGRESLQTYEDTHEGELASRYVRVRKSADAKSDKAMHDARHDVQDFMQGVVTDDDKRLQVQRYRPNAMTASDLTKKVKTATRGKTPAGIIALTRSMKFATVDELYAYLEKS